MREDEPSLSQVNQILIMTERHFRPPPGLLLLYLVTSPGASLRIGFPAFESAARVWFSFLIFRFFSPLDNVHTPGAFTVPGAAVSAAFTLLICLRIPAFRCQP